MTMELVSNQRCWGSFRFSQPKNWWR